MTRPLASATPLLVWFHLRTFGGVLIGHRFAQVVASIPYVPRRLSRKAIRRTSPARSRPCRLRRVGTYKPAEACLRCRRSPVEARNTATAVTLVVHQPTSGIGIGTVKFGLRRLAGGRLPELTSSPIFTGGVAAVGCDPVASVPPISSTRSIGELGVSFSFPEGKPFWASNKRQRWRIPGRPAGQSHFEG